MSIAETARREADKAEREQEHDDEAADDDEAEQAQQAPPEPPPTEPTDEQLAELDAENDRHSAAVFSIMGHFMEGFEPCESCGRLGFQAPGPKPKPNDKFKRCDTCNGFGRVLTGSINPEHADRDCPDCGGRGYLERLEELAPAIAATVPQPSGEPVYGRPTWMGDPAIGGPAVSGA